MFEVPSQTANLPAEERDFIVETREWFEQLQKQLRDEGVAQGLSRGREEGFARGRLQAVSRLAEKRLRRPLVEAERRALAERIDRLGDDRVDEVLLAFSPATLGAWLADPSAV
jgi:flagellar biosynthesis/type III secretory pathway protein FliH